MQATALALDHLLRGVRDPLAELRDIGPADTEFDGALRIRAAVGVLAKTPDALPALAQAIQAADGLSLSPETRAHLAAAETWLSGNPVLAADRYASILSSWPRDLLALRLAQSCYFFLGWHDRLRAVVDAVLPAWTRTRPDSSLLLAMASFAHAENGDAAYAEALGRKALLSDPACPLSAHAVAHALAQSGRHRDGARWMRGQRANWAGAGRMRTHNAWHLAMFEVEEGDCASALRILDGWLLPASARSPLDACDATALLWRLASDGAVATDRWRIVSEAFEHTLTPGFWPYVDLHAGLAHLMAGNHPRSQRLVQAIEQCAARRGYAALRARQITLPALRGLGAWREGRYGEAARLLASVRPLLSDAGGNRLQLELLTGIEREARRRRREELRPT